MNFSKHMRAWIPFPLGRLINLSYYEYSDGKLLAAQPVVLSEVEEGGDPVATLSLPREVAQELMDDLWQCGLRPSEGSGSAGSLLATQKHLADMRAIVFAQLGFGTEKPV